MVNRPLGAGERVWRAGGGGERQVGLASRHLVPIPPARCSLPGHAGHVIITGDSKRVIWAKPAEGTNHLDGVIFFENIIQIHLFTRLGLNSVTKSMVTSRQV